MAAGNWGERERERWGAEAGEEWEGVIKRVKRKEGEVENRETEKERERERESERSERQSAL